MIFSVAVYHYQLSSLLALVLVFFLSVNSFASFSFFICLRGFLFINCVTVLRRFGSEEMKVNA